MEINQELSALIEKYTSHPVLQALLVEDSENDALLLADHLQSAGLNIVWQRVDHEIALLAALDHPWDIVFSDYSMPHFNGKRALEIIRKHDPDMPFIFVSGTIGEDVAVEGMKAGAHDYVMKGNYARLLPAILRELAEARLRRERREASQTLRKMSLAVEQTADSIFITDATGKIEYVNPAFEKLTGYTAAESLGQTAALLKSGMHDDIFYRNMWETLIAGNIFRDVIINRRQNGELFYEEKVISPVKDSALGITHFVATGRDITERMKSEEARTRLVAILDATTDIVSMMDNSGHLLYLNKSGYSMLGLADGSELNKRKITSFLPEWAADQLLNEAFPEAAEFGSWQGEIAIYDAHRDEIPVSCVLVSHPGGNGKTSRYSTILRDITERKQFEHELQLQATHDALTGLPNRVLIQSHLDMEISRSQRNKSLIAVFFLDVDNFKRINDSLGHAAGDSLLRQVSERLQDCLRPSDLVARYGGDEFTIISGGLSSTDDVFVIANKLYDAFTPAFQLPGQEVFVAFSMGIATYPGDGTSTETLLKNADTAMYRAKKQGRNQYQFYTPEMNARGQELLALDTDLRRALLRQEFSLYLQPQLSLRKNTVVGCEALIRWNHPERGLVSPADFIPMLEDSGLILPVGRWVLQEACRLYRMLRESGLPPVRMSINVSARQFNDLEFVEIVRNTLQVHAIPPNHLELEITESTLMQDARTAEAILASLDRLGVRLAIDDFGTGYSSLAYLQRFPLDVLKIDQTFIRDLLQDAGVKAIVEASIVLAHRLDMEVIAEGVETAEQLAFLREQHCDLIQGYFLSRPLPENNIVPFIADFDGSALP